MHLTPEEHTRFMAKIEQTNSCHIWKGPLDKDGYGTFFLRKLNRRAHRVAWFMLHGPIPEGMVVNHTCRNPSCVNPQHLNVVTTRENALKDSTSLPYLNSQKTHCKNGHPFDRAYGRQRYCSICEKAKRARLNRKWRAADNVGV